MSMEAWMGWSIKKLTGAVVLHFYVLIVLGEWAQTDDIGDQRGL